MKKKYMIIGTIVLIAIIIGIYNYYSPTSRTNEDLIDEYPMLKNSAFLDHLMFSAVDSGGEVNKAISESSNGKLTYQFTPNTGFLDELTCTSTNKKPTTKEFSFSSPGDNVVGGWLNVIIVDCGDYYFISSESDVDWKLYGVFEK